MTGSPTYRLSHQMKQYADYAIREQEHSQCDDAPAMKPVVDGCGSRQHHGHSITDCD